MDDGVAKQTQLLGHFLEAHFPLDTNLESDMHRRLSYLTVLPTVDLSVGVLGSAVNSICLGYFGAKDHDLSMVCASRVWYSQVLPAIRRAAEQLPNTSSINHRNVIAAIMLSSLYDGYLSDLEPKVPSSLSTHYMGALNYIESAGPSCLDLTKVFDTRLLQNLRMPALVFSIARRKSLVFGKPLWRTPDSTHMLSAGPTSWFPLMSGFPDLLERAERLKRGIQPSMEAEAYQLCQSMQSFRRQLHEWLDQEFKTGVAPANKPIATVGITDTAAFDNGIEEHIFIVDDERIKSHHRFLGGAGQIIRCSMSWLACLIIDTTFLRLLTTSPGFDRLMPDRSFAQVKQDAYGSAMELCRCVYHYSMMDSVAYLDFEIAFLQLCHNFFEDSDDIRAKGWCIACLAAAEARKKRLKDTRRPTLCRVRDVAAELAEAGRYRTQFHV